MILAPNSELRARKSREFDLQRDSSARSTVLIRFGDEIRSVYSNANFSVYSAQRCNAKCGFCVEELRPASRGIDLERSRAQAQARELGDDEYFSALRRAAAAIAPGRFTLSVTGGEPSKDRRLSRIFSELKAFPFRRRTLTSNGSGMVQPGLLESVLANGLDHLNISCAHPNPVRNRQLMRLPGAPESAQLQKMAELCREAGARLRLSCVLLNEGICDLEGVMAYLDFAKSLGIDNVIFRQLMKSDPRTHATNEVVQYSDAQRVEVAPLLAQLGEDGPSKAFRFQKQIVGYYYYVEVWRWQGIDVVFEEADLGHLESAKNRDPSLVHEMVFHPTGTLNSTWQPWDGILLGAAAK